MAVRDLSQIQRSAVHGCDLMLELVRRDLKLRYQRSMLGILWTLLNPLAQLLVFSFVFRYVLPLNIPNYTAFLFTGLLAWNWLQAGLSAGTGAIVDHRDLVKRPGFPLWVLPMVIIVTGFLHYLLALPVLLGFLLVNEGALPATILLLPAVLAAQFLFMLGITYILSTVHVTFRDTQYLLGVVLMLGFYLSPVLYGPDAVPDRFLWLYRLNPVAVLLQAYRDILLRGHAPGAPALILLSAVSLGLIFVGIRLFQRGSSRFVEEL